MTLAPLDNWLPVEVTAYLLCFQLAGGQLLSQEHVCAPVESGARASSLSSNAGAVCSGESEEQITLASNDDGVDGLHSFGACQHKVREHCEREQRVEEERRRSVR